MPQNPIFPDLPVLALGGKEIMLEGKPKKRQVNYYADPDNDIAIAHEVFERKMVDREFSASQLTNNALRLYFMVRRFQKEFKDQGEPYDLVREAVAVHFGKKRK